MYGYEITEQPSNYGLKIQCPRGRAGSTPAAGTTLKLEMLLNQHF